MVCTLFSAIVNSVLNNKIDLNWRDDIMISIITSSGNNSSNNLMQIQRSELSSSNAKEGEQQQREGIPNNNGEDESLESLDSLYSSKTGGESLDSLPSFNSPLAPTTPTNDTADKSNPRSWKKYASGRSSNSIAAGSSSSKSTSFRINTKLFKSSPKKLFKGSNNKKEVASTPNQATTTHTSPSRPVSSISQQQQTQQLSPLTPMNNTRNGDSTIATEYTAASTNSTPTANNIHTTRSNNSTPEISNKLDHIKVPVIETQTRETKPNNDNELKAALDKLGKNVDALKILSPKASASSIISPTDKDYAEFLKLIDHKDERMTDKEEEVSSEGEQDEKEEQSNENDCQCWCPGFLRNIFCGKSKSAIVQPQPVEYQVYLDEDEEPNNHNHVKKEEKKSWADELKDKARVRQIVHDCTVNK